MSDPPLRNPHVTPTFKTETLRLVSNVQLVKRLFTAKRKANTALPCSLFNSNSRRASIVTKATPIGYIDSTEVPYIETIHLYRDRIAVRLV